jgi:LDH2 family malate/lactate/ureidoglycolate dehydrogenase
MLAYVNSSAPIDPAEPVRVPYELESRLRCRRSSDGITIDDVSWQRVVDLAGDLDLEIE